MSDVEHDLAPVLGPITDDNEGDLNLPPATGSEYLRRVQYDNKIFTFSDHVAAPDGFAPAEKWQHVQAKLFSDVRLRLQHYKETLRETGAKAPNPLPNRKDVEAWCHLCFGKIKPDEIPKMVTTLKETVTEDTSDSTDTTDDVTVVTGTGDGLTVTETPAQQTQATGAGESASLPEDNSAISGEGGRPPYLSIVAFMDQPTVVQVLEYHITWFEETGYTLEQGRWFYALLASLEKPLVPEACSLIRQLSKECAKLRSTLTHASDPLLVHLNIIISLVSRYFEQLDLADKDA